MIKLPENSRIWITKLRTSNLKIPIETGRWHNIPLDERICHKCNEGIGDEFHYMFVCKSPDLLFYREKFIPKYYLTYPCKQKLIGLSTYCNATLYNKVASFIRKIVSIL